MTPLHVPDIETDRLLLRAPRFEDYPAFETFLLSDRAKFIGGPGPDAKGRWRAFAHIAGLWLLRPPSSFVVALKSEPQTPIGLAGPWYPMGWPEPELGWSLWTDATEGKGLAFEAAAAARDYVFGQCGWTTAVSYIDPDNTRSITLAERLGASLDQSATAPDPTDLVYRHTPAGAAQ